MIFTVYSGKDGAFLLFPDDKTASGEANLSHGPLSTWGKIDSEKHAIPALWKRVREDIEQHSFAVLQKKIGRELLGLNTGTRRAIAHKD